MDIDVRKWWIEFHLMLELSLHPLMFVNLQFQIFRLICMLLVFYFKIITFKAFKRSSFFWLEHVPHKL